MTPRERLEACLTDTTVRPPRLEQMAELLRADGRFTVSVTATWGTKDRVFNGIRWPGKKRYTGKCLEVRKGAEVLIHHDTMDTYRSNHELAGKVLDLLT